MDQTAEDTLPPPFGKPLVMNVTPDLQGRDPDEVEVMGSFMGHTYTSEEVLTAVEEHDDNTRWILIGFDAGKHAIFNGNFVTLSREHLKASDHIPMQFRVQILKMLIEGDSEKLKQISDLMTSENDE